MGGVPGARVGPGLGGRAGRRRPAHLIPTETAAARDRAIARLLALQSPRGDWEGEMVWCPVITAQYVIVRGIVGRPVDPDTRAGIIRHFGVTQDAGGAWGLHPESSGTLFVTTMVYVALRMLGVEPADPRAARGREWVARDCDGVVGVPTWGKLWLAMLDLYGWDGVAPCPPELLLLPRALPLHPSRYYCHTRLIFLAMAYLYGRRFTADLDGSTAGVRTGSLRESLRAELYDTPYARIDFGRHVGHIARRDLAVAPGPPLRFVRRALRLWERLCSPGLRRRALTASLTRIIDEQRASHYQGLSPVSGLLACLALFAEDPRHPELSPNLDGLEAWRWEDGAEGVRYAGARSNTWDTAFALEAIAGAGVTSAASRDGVARARRFLLGAQMTESLSPPLASERDLIEGGWCFSDGRHRWPVSDCTAEAVAALLASDPTNEPAPRLDAHRLGSALTFILSRQNADGGFGTYEARRAGVWLEALNGSEMFARCMTDRSWNECTASALVALACIRAEVPGLRRHDVERAISRAIDFLRTRQRAGGSVAAAWGINIVYGTFHFVRGLRAAGVSGADPQLVRAADWLVAHQRDDGGWGEHWSGCLEECYVEHTHSQVVTTAWALLALLEVVGADADSVRRGVAWLVSRQDSQGGWPHGGVNGVFFGTAMLDYRLYPVYFPAWALARYVGAAAPSTRASSAAIS